MVYEKMNEYSKVLLQCVDKLVTTVLTNTLAEKTKRKDEIMTMFVCLRTFDPCYGFSLIRPNALVFVSDRELGREAILRLLNEHGRIVGTISAYELERHFEVAS